MILLDILTQRVYNIIRIGNRQRRRRDKALRTKSWTGRKEGIMYTREQKEKALAMYGRGHSAVGISVETGVVRMDSKLR